MATSPPSNPTDQRASSLLAKLKETRFLTSSELLTTLNPERLHVSGAGAPGIGADPATSGPFYVFITRPDLNIAAANAKDVLGVGSPMMPSAIAEQLTGGTGVVKLLTNLCEGFQAQDAVMDTMTIGEGWDGSKMTTPKNTLNSLQNGTIQLEFEEMVGTPVTLTHKLWVDYIDAVTRGTIWPKESGPEYVTRRVLDYAVSIYCFQTLPDASTIQFGMKLTGCFPTAVPYSAFRGQRGPSEAIKVTVPYAYSYMEAMDNVIFSEFSNTAAGSGVRIEGAGLGNAGGGRSTPTAINGVATESGRLVYRLVFTGAKSAATINQR